jgi:hypothetical protein
MIYYGVTLDDVSKSKLVTMLWSSKHDNCLSIITEPSGQ